LLFFWLKLHFITQQFLLMMVQGLVFFPGVPRYAIDTHTTGFRRCAVIQSLANQALPAVYQEKVIELRKVLSPKTTSELTDFFSYTTC